jgi:hypothetical protein
MPGMRMTHAANEAKLIGLARQPRQVLANPNAGNIAVNGAKFPSKLGRGVGLQVKNIDLAGPSEKVDHNASVGPAETGRGWRRGRSAQDLGQAHPHGRQAADLKPIAAGATIASSKSRAGEPKHANLPS